MTAPRHLWSGDWRRESADAARELAERRAEDDEPTVAQAATPAEAPAPARPKRRGREDTAPKPRATPALAPKPRTASAPAPTPRAGEPVAARPPAPAPRRSPTPPRPRTEPGWRSWHGSRFALVFLAVLVSGGIAYAAVSALVGSGNDNSAPPISQANPPSKAAPAAGGPAWLGVDTQSVGAGSGGFSSGSGNTGGFSGTGAVVTNVAPGSPADAAGLEPGDVITQINTQTVNSPNDITSALAGMHVGQQVEIQYQRGPFADAAQVTLAARPPGSP